MNLQDLEPRISQYRARFAEVEREVADPELHRDQRRAADTMREHARLTELLGTWDRLVETVAQLDQSHAILEAEEDQEMRSLAEEELDRLEQERHSLERTLRLLLVPPSPYDQKNTIVEIRAGTGGDEAALFASDLYRMYARYAENRGWKLELIEAHETEIGGFREIVFSISGRDVYSLLKFESGVHRVQRVPATESQGRIHTSTVTVAVLPEAEETDIQIKPEEIRVDVFRSSGPGGQSVNTTDSAVRITHLPTGLVVSCQDEKSQHKNKAKALRVLKARLLEMEERRRNEEQAETRRTQIGSGDRSERIRTYNFPQNRLTDHRINLTLYRLEYVMNGDIDEILDALRLSATEEALSS